MLEKFQNLDNKIIRSIVKIHKPSLNIIMILASKAGTFGTVWWVISLLFTAHSKLRALGLNMILAMCFSFLMGEIILKHIVRRVRPCHNLDEEDWLVSLPRFYSFPSGHTTVSFAVAGVVLLKGTPEIFLPILLLAVLIGFSRIYLRVHYFSDVFVGMLLGFVCGISSVLIFDYAAPILLPSLS